MSTVSIRNGKLFTKPHQSQGLRAIIKVYVSLCEYRPDRGEGVGANSIRVQAVACVAAGPSPTYFHTQHSYPPEAGEIVYR